MRTGSVVPSHYDSLMAKLIVTGATRAQALRRAKVALDEMVIAGVPSVLPFHRAVVRNADFTNNERYGVYTTWIESEFAEELASSPEIAAAEPGAGARDPDHRGRRQGHGHRPARLPGRCASATAATAPHCEAAAENVAAAADDADRWPPR